MSGQPAAVGQDSLFGVRDGTCPNYRPGDADAPCEPDATGYCLSCGFWAPLYPADRSRPVLVPQGVMRRLMVGIEALNDIAGRAWRDEGGRIAAAVARDGLAGTGRFDPDLFDAKEDS